MRSVYGERKQPDSKSPAMLRAEKYVWDFTDNLVKSGLAGYEFQEG
jgi:hypothetical protein